MEKFNNKSHAINPRFSLCKLVDKREMTEKGSAGAKN